MLVNLYCMFIVFLSVLLYKLGHLFMNNSTVIDVMVLIFLFRMQQTHCIHAVSRPPSVAFHSGADLYSKRACTRINMTKHSV